MRLSIVIKVLMASTLAFSSTSFAVSVDAWSLVAAVNDQNQVPAVTGAIFTVPINPFVNSHSASQPTGATAMAGYAFGWSSISADFQTSCSFVGTGYPNASANVQSVGCTGKIWITPSVDALLSVQAHMDYALGPGDREASGGWSVSRLPILSPVAFGNFFAQPAFGDPPTDVWDSQNSLVLLAGQQYLLRYAFEVASLPGSGTQSQLSNGTASVLFHIDALPEPAALGPLAFAALLTCRPKKKRSS